MSVYSTNKINSIEMDFTSAGLTFAAVDLQTGRSGGLTKCIPSESDIVTGPTMYGFEIKMKTCKLHRYSALTHCLP